MSGIYAIINRDNLKIYIGSATILSHRWNAHRHALWERKHNSNYLQRAFNKNPSAFYIELIEELPGADKATILSREQFWIDFYQSFKPENGYNTCQKAASCQGVKHRREVVERMAARQRKPWKKERLEDWRRQMAGFKYTGHKWTDGQKMKLSLSHIGKKWKPGQREKVLHALSKNPKGFNKKRVAQFSIKGELIKEFSSVKEAEDQFGARSNIHAVCKGKREKAFGFIWRYA